jgi:regulatory protein
MSSGKKREKLKITKLEPQKRNPRRVSIYLGGRFALGIDAQVAQELSLRQGMELSQGQLQKIALAEEKSRAKNFALDFIGYRARSIWEVTQRLKKRGHSQRIIEQVLRELHQSGLLDDIQFAARWAKGRLATKPLGERLLRHELKLKGISDEIVEKTVAEIFDQVSQRELAADLLRARHQRYSALDKLKAKRRMADFLLRRGFPRDIVWEVVDQVMSEGNCD